MPIVHVQAQSLDDVRRAVRRLARKLDASSTTFPTFGASEQTGRPHVECSGNRFDFVVCERGTEFERRSTEDVHVLLYWIFKGIGFELACDFELAHRQPRTDCRRVIFAKSEELMAMLDDNWARSLADEYRAILVDHPFDDLASERAVRCRELREAGHSDDEARRLAQALYPPVGGSRG